MLNRSRPETRIRKRGAPQRVGRRILIEGPQVAADGANLCRRQRASEVESVRHHLGARYPVSDQRRDLGIVGGLEEVAGAQRRGKATGATNPVTGLAAADEDLRPLVGQELLLLNAGLGGAPVRRTGTAGRPVRREPSGRVRPASICGWRPRVRTVRGSGSVRSLQIQLSPRGGSSRVSVVPEGAPWVMAPVSTATMPSSFSVTAKRSMPRVPDRTGTRRPG